MVIVVHYFQYHLLLVLSIVRLGNILSIIIGCICSRCIIANADNSLNPLQARTSTRTTALSGVSAKMNWTGIAPSRGSHMIAAKAEGHVPLDILFVSSMSIGHDQFQHRFGMVGLPFRANQIQMATNQLLL